MTALKPAVKHRQHLTTNWSERKISLTKTSSKNDSNKIKATVQLNMKYQYEMFQFEEQLFLVLSLFSTYFTYIKNDLNLNFEVSSDSSLWTQLINHVISSAGDPSPPSPSPTLTCTLTCFLRCWWSRWLRPCVDHTWTQVVQK